MHIIQLVHLMQLIPRRSIAFCASGLPTPSLILHCYHTNRYNHTGYTTPEGYDPSDEYIVLLPDSLSDTCRRFRLSALTATNADAWRFHMLMFWNSSYNATENPGAFQSIKMYLYQGDLTREGVAETPITLYAPISFDAQEVPFVRGFLEYEQHVSLNEHLEHTFRVVDTTTAPWFNAEDAVSLAASYGTDSLASIQLDIRAQSFYQYAEVSAGSNRA